MEDRWTVALWAKNLTDKTVTTFAFFPGSERYSLNAPRTYGLELGFKF
jgi:outer membrane receptor protein involved in Fe transport